MALVSIDATVNRNDVSIDSAMEDFGVEEAAPVNPDLDDPPVSQTTLLALADLGRKQFENRRFNSLFSGNRQVTSILFYFEPSDPVILEYSTA